MDQTAADVKKVLVTGAAGRLGSRVAELFHSEGYDVLATDVAEVGEVPYRFIQANLLDHEHALRLLAGVDAVLHMGNHPGLGHTPPQVVFNENVSINENIFQGAAECKVARIVFASTLQLVGSHIDERTVVNLPIVPSYPMSGSTDPDPSNVYALSKTVSEVMLRYYASRCGIDCVALRFPLLHNHEDRFLISAGEEDFTDIQEGFSGLTYDDAAALFLAVIGSNPTGYRVYMAGTSHRHRTLTMPELLRTHYPSISENIPDLIDCSAILSETGWELGSGYGPHDRS